MRFDLTEISGAFQDNRVPPEIAFPISLNVLGTASKTMRRLCVSSTNYGSRRQLISSTMLSLTLTVCLSLVTASGAL